MANGKESGMVTLVERAFSVKDSDKIYSMTIDDHKLICSVLDAHLDVVELKVNALNNAFHAKMIQDVSEVIRDQWPNALAESMKDYTKDRDRKLLKYILVASIIVFLLSVIAGLIASIWYHEHYLVMPRSVSMLLSLIGL
jgi:hypothetical protein